MFDHRAPDLLQCSNIRLASVVEVLQIIMQVILAFSCMQSYINPVQISPLLNNYVFRVKFHFIAMHSYIFKILSFLILMLT